MTVLTVAYPFAPVRPNTAGGAEHVVAMLDRALTHAGHRSLVIACQGSQVTGTLIPIELPPGLITDAVTERIHAVVRDTITRSIYQFQPDLVHCHGIDFSQYLPATGGPPVVATLHLPPSWYPPAIFSLARPRTYLHCVSHAQFCSCPATSYVLPTIENGVPEPTNRQPIRKRHYAVVMGRICPEKGIDTAIRAAQAAKIPLLIAGEVFPYEAHIRYFEEQVKPHLNGANVRFVGPVGTRAKQRLLSAATCVLVPSNVAETSSLVAMEAAMCGTPVVAFRMGALTEIVAEGRTGFLVQTETEMSQAIARCSALDPAQCRSIARERFSEQRAQSEYLAMYRQLAP